MQSPIQRNAYVFPILLLATIFVGCPQQLRIGELTSNTGRYANREVTVTGTVVSSFGLLGQSAYELDDGTGKIWVLSQNFGTPSKGTRVGITGRVTQGVNLGGRSFAVALRQSHETHY
ncbi:MAG TPA: OB-fold nucleic acid binding domain-containing protein [Terriglobales bacterium]|nr:OB-fold nucleic acid binding domain-containing protein [Terriglobales bacterium]